MSPRQKRSLPRNSIACRRKFPRRSVPLRDARHILLEHSLRASGEKPVPISLELDENHQVLVISGPNAGGKTVVLKTVGLVSLMAQMGFHVPARDAASRFRSDFRGHRGSTIHCGEPLDIHRSYAQYRRNGAEGAPSRSRPSG